MTHTARVLRRARIKVGMSQAEISRRIGYTSGQFVSNLERGISSLPMSRMTALCDLLRIKPQVLLGAMTRDMVKKAKLKMKASIRKARRG